MVVEEPAFPRGGTSSAPNENASYEPVKSNFFDISKPNKKKTKTKAVGTKGNEEVKHRVVTGAAPHLVSLDDLSYRVLSEGMIVLGRITDISDYYLDVSLPGLISGKVPVTQISEPYSNLLQSMSGNDDNMQSLCPLSELFYKGQLVCAQVWQIQKTEDHKHNVILSLDPRLVHTDWSHSSMAVKGLVVTAAVKSKEEHGYVMDCGVNGLRSFLKEDRAQNYCATLNGGRPLAVGQLVRCIVTRADTSLVSSNVELSADPDDVARRESKGCVTVDVQNILPGMRFTLSVVEAMPNGVKVDFMTQTGYIHRNHIPGEQLDPGSTVFGRVLYITPMVKNIFFSTLPNISNVVKEMPKADSAEIAFKVGNIIENAKVTGVGVKGVFLQLKKKQNVIRGFVPERRMGFNYKGKLEDDNDEDSMMQRLRKKFPIGSSVRCRLLHFCSLIETYVCTMEKPELDEQFHTWSDVKVGDVVPCVVEDIRRGGINVNVGKLSGFVPAIHSADVPLHQPALSFPQGTKVTGRVLKVDGEKRQLIITLKKSLVSSKEPALVSQGNTQVGACHLGTVVAVQPDHVYLSFFGDVRGYLACTSDRVPEGHKFFLGQLLKCYVERLNTKLLSLSLKPLTDAKPLKLVPLRPDTMDHAEPSHTDVSELQKVLVGCPYNIEVTSIDCESIQVRVTNDGKSLNANGIIPILHLSDDPKMSEALFNTMKIGTLITDVWCIINTSEEGVIFSMRFSVSQFFRGYQGKGFGAVSPGWILPCTVVQINSDHIVLESPVIAERGPVEVPQELICDRNGSIESLGLVEGQGIQAKVVWVRSDSIALSCKKNHIWDGELVTSVLYLSRYLSDQHRLLQHAKKVGDPIGTYCVGQNFKGTVKEKTEWGFLLESKIGVAAEVTFFNAQSEDLEIGSPVHGKVINVDYLRGHVEVTLNTKICSSLKIQETFIKIEPQTRMHANAILVTPEFILVQLKGNAHRGNLAHIPTYLDPFSHSKLSVDQPFFGIDRKVIVQRCTNNAVICLPNEVVVDRKDELRLAARRLLKAKRGDASVTNGKGVRYFDQTLNDEVEIKTEEDLENEGNSAATQEDIQIVDISVDQPQSGGHSLSKSRKRKSASNSKLSNTAIPVKKMKRKTKA